MTFDFIIICIVLVTFTIRWGWDCLRSFTTVHPKSSIDLTIAVPTHQVASTLTVKVTISFAKSTRLSCSAARPVIVLRIALLGPPHGGGGGDPDLTAVQASVPCTTVVPPTHQPTSTLTVLPTNHRSVL